MMFEPKIPAIRRYGDNIAQEKLLMLIRPGQRILDVGCGIGKLGYAMKQRGKCEIVGIDVDEKSASFAKSKMGYDSVIVANVEELQKLPFPVDYFDVMVFADMLEHLKRPDLVLINLRKYVSETGFVLASIPNIAHWTMRINLLLGRFNYGELGLLDKTHLRFFTLKTIKELFHNSGYKIIFIEYTEIFLPPKRYLPLWILYRFVKKMFPNLLAFQYVVKAVKSEEYAEFET